MFGRSPDGAHRDAVRRVKAWVGEAFRLPPDVTVVVSELQCREPDCPPIETIIALLRGPGDTTHYTLHQAAADVTLADVVALTAAPAVATPDPPPDR